MTAAAAKSPLPTPKSVRTRPLALNVVSSRSVHVIADHGEVVVPPALEVPGDNDLVIRVDGHSGPRSAPPKFREDLAVELNVLSGVPSGL
jgi:hypothetical protein